MPKLTPPMTRIGSSSVISQSTVIVINHAMRCITLFCLRLETSCDLSHDSRPIPQVVDPGSTEIPQVSSLAVSSPDDLDVLDHWTTDFESLFYACPIHNVSKCESGIYPSTTDTEKDT